MEFVMIDLYPGANVSFGVRRIEIDLVKTCNSHLFKR